MTTAMPAASPVHRISSWLHGGERGGRTSRATAVPTTRERARRQQFDDIGDFLVAHDLELSAHNFRVARDQVAGDPAINRAVAALLREHGRLIDAMLEGLGGGEGIKPELLSDVAGALAERLSECLRIVGQSTESARDYGAALDVEAKALADDPVGALDRLIPLTRDVVEATRAMEARLDVARRETERLKAKVQTARRDAECDHLTGPPNRRAFDVRLAQIELAGTPGGRACVALCGIDDFKAINDAHGHDAGDRVLKFVARLFRSELGDRAMVARYGGEEFVCLFEDTAAADARDLLEVVVRNLAERSLINQATGAPIGWLTFSAGLSAIAEDPRAAMRAADDALYQAKRAGKNRVVQAVG